MFVGVSGLIGAGKSTFTKQITTELSRRGAFWASCFEPVETNPYLEDFYADIPRWTFNMQMFLLAARFRQHQEILWAPYHRTGGGAIQDRTIYEDTIFARMHWEDGVLSERDWNTYLEHFTIMKGFLRYPDLVVHLRVKPETAMRRIQERGREAERGIPLDYLERLNAGYDEFVVEMARYTKVIDLDWENFGSVPEVADLVQRELESHRPKYLRNL
jgi:deoxyadenosine/deoxycytidine kinase